MKPTGQKKMGDSALNAVGILISDAGYKAFADTIKQHCEPHASPRFIVHDPQALPDDGALAAIDIAYVTTELAGRAGDTDPEARMRAFSRDLLAAPHLKWLHVCSAGTDRPVYAQLARRRVVLTHSSGANARAVAHTAMAGMLALARNVPMWVRAQQQRRWQTQRHDESCDDLDGSRVVVVGLGSIGREIARLCKAFGMHVVGVRRNATPMPECDEVHAQHDLANLLHDADWLVLACPLTPDTRHLVNAQMLARLPAHARLINVGRGAVVDEAALVHALNTGALAGAYSDVFTTEPLPADSPLWDARNFLVSAHSAGASKGFGSRATAIFVNNLQRWLKKEPLINKAHDIG